MVSAPALSQKIKTRVHGASPRETLDSTASKTVKSPSVFRSHHFCLCFGERRE